MEAQHLEMQPLWQIRFPLATSQGLTMTTSTTNSQAASIDTPEFRQLLKDYSFYGIERGTPPLIAHIDAKLAQAGDDWRDRANVLEARLGEVMEKRDEFRERTIAAESRLAEIQRGVENLQVYEMNDCIDVFEAKDVLALLQPQGEKSDTSGLPG